MPTYVLSLLFFPPLCYPPLISSCSPTSFSPSVNPSLHPSLFFLSFPPSLLTSLLFSPPCYPPLASSSLPTLPFLFPSAHPSLYPLPLFSVPLSLPPILPYPPSLLSSLLAPPPSLQDSAHLSDVSGGSGHQHRLDQLGQPESGLPAQR